MISGKLLTALLTWLLLSPAFRVRKFSQGNKQGVLSPGGLSLTLSYFFGLMRNMTMSVALGYHSVYLCIVPQLLTALLLWICKCFADKEFKSWSVGDQITYVLIGSVVPCIIPNPNREIPAQNVEDQEGAGTGDNEKEESEAEDPQPESKAPHESASKLEEAEELQGEDHDRTDEELKEFIRGKRSSAKELCGIFILHAVNVILGVAAFAFLHETSTELVTAETKVNDANKINLMPVINISSISSTHRHSHNRTMSQGQGRK